MTKEVDYLIRFRGTTDLYAAGIGGLWLNDFTNNIERAARFENRRDALRVLALYPVEQQKTASVIGVAR